MSTFRPMKGCDLEGAPRHPTYLGLRSPLDMTDY